MVQVKHATAAFVLCGVLALAKLLVTSDFSAATNHSTLRTSSTMWTSSELRRWVVENPVTEGERAMLVTDFDTLIAGDNHYRAYVGTPKNYDIIGGTQFSVLLAGGLRDTHTFLEVGCGSLRLGRLLISYLNPGHYHCIEPNDWLFKTGMKYEVGADILDVKDPTFYVNTDFLVEQDAGWKFDFAMSYSIFSHTSPKMLANALAQLRPRMHSGSVLIATLKVVDAADYNPDNPDNQDHDLEHGDWVYPGLVHFTESHVRDIASDAGMFCTRLSSIAWSQTFFAFGLDATTVDATAAAITSMIKLDLQQLS